MPEPITLKSSTPKEASHSRLDNIRGIMWMLVSVLGASAMTLAVREAAQTLDSRYIVVLRAFGTSAAIGAAVILFTPARRLLKFSLPKKHLIRGTLIAAATHFGFYTLSTIPLTTATVLFFTGPIFATIISVLALGEGIGPRRIAAIFAGFVGTLVVLRPGFEAFHPAMLTALASSLCFALALTMSRGLARADGALSTYFSSVVITLVVSLPFTIDQIVMPQGWMLWFAILIVVVTSAIRGYADIEAYRHAEAGILAPIAYLRIVFIAAGAYVIFDEVPDPPTIVGGAIIVGATLYIALRENRLRKRKAGS